jgi:hypothetical protein
VATEIKAFVSRFTSSKACPWPQPEDLVVEDEEEDEDEKKGSVQKETLEALRKSSKDFSLLKVQESVSPQWTSFDSSHLEKFEKDAVGLKVSRQFEIAVMEEVIVEIASSDDAEFKKSSETLLYLICGKVGMSKEDFAANTKVTVKAFKKVG